MNWNGRSFRPAIRTVLFLLFAMTVGEHALAQFGGTFSLTSGYDDNPFRTSTPVPQVISQSSLLLGYFPEESWWAVSYSGSLTMFHGSAPTRYSTHSLAGSAVFPFGESEGNSMTILTTLSGRFDPEEYTLYDYRQMLASASLKLLLDETFPVRTGYSYRDRSYPNAPVFGYSEHRAFFNLSKSFETKTSLSLNVQLGHRVAASDQLVTVDTTAVGGTVGSNGGGKGKNGNGQQNGNGTGSHSVLFNASYPYMIFTDPIATQMTAQLRLGQAITEEMGVSLTYLQRFTLRDRGVSSSGGMIDLFGEEELFDDPYAYESREYSLMVSRILPWSLTLRVAGEYRRKNYLYTLATDLQRRDEQIETWLQVRKGIREEWLLFSGIELTLGYVYLRNSSNADLYDMHNHSIVFGFTGDF